MKWTKFVFSILLVCLLCSGCGGKQGGRQDDPGDATGIETRVTAESGSEPASETDLPENRPLPPVPKTKEEEEELFGRTTPSGQWIPPEGSYKSSNGNIYNKEGLVIGSWRKPTEKEIADAVG